MSCTAPYPTPFVLGLNGGLAAQMATIAKPKIKLNIQKISLMANVAAWLSTTRFKAAYVEFPCTPSCCS